MSQDRPNPYSEQPSSPMNRGPYGTWEVIIGLETHAQLNTKTKLFSPALNRFGDEPNTNLDPVCLGLPGALPRLNKEAVRKAVQVGCALKSEISTVSRFDRKSYYYPDSPRNFQITQFYQPILVGGTLSAELHGRWIDFEIDRAHLEDDAGMLKHFGSFAGVDYNRAGAPLIEIVSKPCIYSPEEAKAYVTALKQLLEFLGVCDCNMEQGHLRIDVNVSVRPMGEEELRPKAEIKNMNSITNLGLALDAEIKRQIRLYEEHPTQSPSELMSAATYRFDPDTKKTVQMRTKESAADYRYFPEPDLPPIHLDPGFIEKIRSLLPELPKKKKQRFIEQLALSEYQASTLLSHKTLCNYFEEALRTLKEPTNLAASLYNWIMVEFVGRFHDKGTTLTESGILPAHLAQLTLLIHKEVINGKIAKKVADAMVDEPGRSPEAIIASNPDYQPVNDSSQIESWVDEVLTRNGDAINDYRMGKQKAYGFLVGQVMALSRGKADPAAVNAILKKKLSS